MLRSMKDIETYLDLGRDAVKNSPSYDPAAPLGREQEISIHAHDGREPYWPAQKHPTETSRARE
jgi:hypothetical protein